MFFDPHAFLQEQGGTLSKVTKVTKVEEGPPTSYGTLDSLDTLDTLTRVRRGQTRVAIVLFDQIINLIERAFRGSSFIGTKPKGWLSKPRWTRRPTSRAAESK